VRLTERRPNGCSLQRAPRSRCRLDAEASNTPPLIALTGTSEGSPGRARAYLVRRNHRDLTARAAGLRGQTLPAGRKRRVESASLSCPWSRVQSSIASASAANAHHPGVGTRAARPLMGFARPSTYQAAGSDQRRGSTPDFAASSGSLNLLTRYSTRRPSGLVSCR
jgi:hypothetical protein